MTIMYNVYEIDVCFDQYAMDDILVGGLSPEDIMEHINEIYPPLEIKIKKEDWMNEYDWKEETENGKYKEGEVKIIPHFTNEQLEKLRDSITDDIYSRFKKVENLYTDKPYTILTSFGYIE